MTFSVIHATLGRARMAVLVRELWLKLADNPEDVEYLFGLHDHDAESIALLSGYPHSRTAKHGAGPNLEACAAISTGAVLVQAQDDIYPPEHWDTLLKEKIPSLSQPYFVAVSDGFRKDGMRVTSIMTRAYMEQKARGDCDGCGFGHPGYFSMYWDAENSHRAIVDGVTIDASDLLFFHDHPEHTQRPPDETYHLENAKEHYVAGRKLFYERNPDAIPPNPVASK